MVFSIEGVFHCPLLNSFCNMETIVSGNCARLFCIILFYIKQKKRNTVYKACYNICYKMSFPHSFFFFLNSGHLGTEP